jgi:hypothetical protein
MKKESEFYIVTKAGEHFTVTVNTDILYKLIKFNRSWHVAWEGWEYYVVCSEYLCKENGKSKYKTHYLQRWIFGDPDDKTIDHKNHDTFNNKRSNLRVSDKEKNAKNRGSKNVNNKSGYRNVCWNKQYKQWMVQIMVDGKNKRIGYFDDVDEAGTYAEKMRQEHYGDYAGRS